MIRRPPRSTLSSSSAASDVYKRQAQLPQQQSAFGSDLWMGTQTTPAGGATSQCQAVGNNFGQPNQQGGAPADWDWQSAFRALLPEVNVHFEQGQQQQQAQPPHNNQPGGIWGSQGSAAAVNTVMATGNHSETQTNSQQTSMSWRLPAVLQQGGQQGSEETGRIQGSLYSSNDALWPTLPVTEPQPLQSQPSGAQSENGERQGGARRSRGGKKRGKNKN
eukprot:TRINITY_DN10528_c0_g1_i4.p1 TRINITY_DN10528_c0_g1~~TRINITY_DN10528_c0_g1_i4.p1  ORF type:complete len:219 (+),score=52.66 TRINITY_DN10528_c0_g1_i4:119-775(+)